MDNQEVVKAVRSLLAACNELMTEFVSKKRAANWMVINDGMLAGGAVIKALCAHPNKRHLRSGNRCLDCSVTLD